MYTTNESSRPVTRSSKVVDQLTRPVCSYPEGSGSMPPTGKLKKTSGHKIGQ